MQDSTSQQAAGWYARLRAPDCTAEERAAFDAWCASDPSNAAAYAAAERINDALAGLTMTDPRLRAMVDKAVSAGATLPEDACEDNPSSKSSPKITALQPSIARRSRRRIARPFGWVAGIAAVAGGLWILTIAGSQPARTPDESRYGAGGPVTRYASGPTRRAVTLEDGTRAYLDAVSVIEVRFAETRRDVKLVQGHALFDVAYDADRPFVVTAGGDLVTLF